ncbi:MAG: enoyl-CoA hydratase/isomerase family protein [Deltaproteobacteria bacterium]|nr:MAG: enoyl-CoA hydratase/isomerase family protein [Deltaproteobacteria bacterium]
MPLIEYRIENRVAVVTLNDGENRFNPPFLQSFLDVLDEIVEKTDANALVVTSAHEKIFSNGIDLEWLYPFIQKGDAETAKGFFYLMNRLFKRILLYPMPTIAAISGHAFAGGAIMTCAFDFRFMRSDRGFFCFPEVDLGIPFLPGMIALIQKAIPTQTFQELQLTGKRATAEECEARHIVLKACHRDDLMNEAIQFATGLNKRREVVAEMKRRMHGEIARIIDEEDPPVIESGTFHV